jgi:hypothetical protein
VGRGVDGIDDGLTGNMMMMMSTWPSMFCAASASALVLQLRNARNGRAKPIGSVATEQVVHCPKGTSDEPTGRAALDGLWMRLVCRSG